MQYMVSLQNGNNTHLCGGFLVSKNFVITSASCNHPYVNVPLQIYVDVIHGNYDYVYSKLLRKK